MRSPIVTTQHILLAGLIDYAGLFPPASLDMDAAVTTYRGARGGPYAWLLGRYLCPTSRLEELGAQLTATMRKGESPWKVGAIFDEPPAAAATHAQAFEAAMGSAASTVVAEARVPEEAADGRTAIEAADVMAPPLMAATSISPRLVTFLEVPRTEQWEIGLPAAIGGIDVLANRSHREIGAKLRCGGLGVEDFPTCAQIAVFISVCVTAGVPFKATAGLHHPVRHFDEDLGGYRHGFLNILTATALAESGVTNETLETVLAEEDPQAFRTSGGGIGWRDHSAGTSVVKRIRRDRFTAYGSCSFDEPIADLVALGLIAGPE